MKLVVFHLGISRLLLQLLDLVGDGAACLSIKVDAKSHTTEQTNGYSDSCCHSYVLRRAAPIVHPGSCCPRDCRSHSQNPYLSVRRLLRPNCNLSPALKLLPIETTFQSQQPKLHGSRVALIELTLQKS